MDRFGNGVIEAPFAQHPHAHGEAAVTRQHDVTAAFEIIRRLRETGSDVEKLESIPHRADIADAAIDDGHHGHWIAFSMAEIGNSARPIFSVRAFASS